MTLVWIGLLLALYPAGSVDGTQVTDAIVLHIAWAVCAAVVFGMLLGLCDLERRRS